MAALNTSSGLDSLFGALSDRLAQKRQADSISSTILPLLPGASTQAPQPSGGFFDKLSNLFGGPTAAPLAPPAALSQPTQPAPAAAPAPTAAPMAFAPPAAAPSMTAPRPAPAAPQGFAPAPSGPLPSFAAAGGAPGQDNTSRALAFYQSKGLSPLAASALVGGFQTESTPGLNTRAVNVGDGQDGSNSIGIPQWNGDRARGFLNYARSNNLDPHDIDTQLQYSWLELNGSEKGTLNALQQAQNPAQATAAALGYERPAGWSAQNPYGAKTFGSRLKNTVGLATTGFNTPFNGQPIGPNPNGFTPDPQAGALPSFAASGQGMRLPGATAFPQQAPATAPAPTAFAATTASAPGQRAIAAASPAASDEDDDKPETVQVPARSAAQPAPPIMPAPQVAAPTLGAPAAAAAPAAGSGMSVTPDMIRALLQNPDTQALGVKLFETLATSKTAPIIGHAGDVILDGRTGQPVYSIPNKPEVTDAIKNYQFGQSNPGFTQYQQDQQKADKAQLVEIPLPNGQFQKAWAPPGQIPSPASYVGAPYTRQAPNQVNIDQKAETSQEGEVGKAIGQEIGETLKAGATAPQALNTIRMMRSAAAAGGDSLSTGPLGQATLKAKQAIGNALNIEIPGTSEAEVLNNLGYGLATQAARAISNRPTQFEFGQALAVKPGIAQSKAGFQALLNIRQQDLEDQLALGKLASVKANRDNWMSVKAQYYADHPVMSPFDPSQPLGAQDVQTINGSAQQSAPGATSISSQDAAALPVASSPADAAKLKPGTMFKTPDGRIKVR